MRSDYTEQDTERARQAEASSAGVQTQRLPALDPSEYPVEPSSRTNYNQWIGFGLVTVGLLALMARSTGGALNIEAGIVLLSVASGLLFFAFWRHIYGLLIPGSILAGLSLGVTFADVTNGVSVLWGLALGFLGILLVGRAAFGVHSPWPIFPAVPLFLVGVIVAATSLPTIFTGGVVWLPLALIALGVYLGMGRGTHHGTHRVRHKCH